MNGSDTLLQCKYTAPNTNTSNPLHLALVGGSLNTPKRTVVASPQRAFCYKQSSAPSPQFPLGASKNLTTTRCTSIEAALLSEPTSGQRLSLYRQPLSMHRDLVKLYMMQCFCYHVLMYIIGYILYCPRRTAHPHSGWTTTLTGPFRRGHVAAATNLIGNLYDMSNDFFQLPHDVRCGSRDRSNSILEILLPLLI